VPKQHLVFLTDVIQRFEVIFGDHQQVSWSLRINVVNDYASLILKYNISGDQAIDQTAKQAIWFAHILRIELRNRVNRAAR
jgi:hypothetical protein